jgi:putative SOS response-associated peptidase YedK
MCGKFTAQASWSEVVDFSQPITKSGGSESGDEGSNDEFVTYRVGGLLPVIVWDPETHARRVAKMRWGFPDPRDWRRPRPIHARLETIEAKEPFRTPFHAGQRGIVVFRTFNEGEEVVKPSGRAEIRQWTVDPQTVSRAASPLSGGGLKFPICPYRCWRAPWRPSRPTRSFAERIKEIPHAGDPRG